MLRRWLSTTVGRRGASSAAAAAGRSSSELVNELTARGLLHATTAKDTATLQSHLSAKPRSVYLGVDPTADALHLGNLLPLMALMHFQRHGHRPVVLIGGATGMIGDPSGRDSERKLMAASDIERNVQRLRVALEKLLADIKNNNNNNNNGVTFVNNFDWYSPMSVVDFLRDVGKHFRVSSMLAKDSVRSRMQDSDEGISFTEFAYQTLQAHDFWHLLQREQCTVQLGGSDQWGNITAGCDLIHKRTNAQERDDGVVKQSVFGVTVPLLTTAQGAKFGKSAGNAVWLDADKTSPYELYQYLLQTDDRDVVRMLKLFTFLPLDEIAQLEQAHGAAPEKRDAHRALAEQVTRMLHGQEGVDRALRSSQLLFGGKFDASLTEADIVSVFDGVPQSEVPYMEVLDAPNIVDFAVECGAVKSKSEARRLIKAGGLYINNERVADAGVNISPEHLVGSDESCIVLRTGKRKHHLVRIKYPASVPK